MGWAWIPEDVAGDSADSAQGFPSQQNRKPKAQRSCGDARLSSLLLTNYYAYQIR
jgi:hypothetical protein